MGPSFTKLVIKYLKSGAIPPPTQFYTKLQYFDAFFFYVSLL